MKIKMDLSLKWSQSLGFEKQHIFFPKIVFPVLSFSKSAEVY